MSWLRLGILGYPLEHTMSPRLHQCFLEQSGLTGNYEVFSTPSELLSGWVTSQGRLLKGFNVTIPHKRAIMAHLAAASESARLIGAVNTVIQTDTGLYGENTDAHGFMAPLPESLRNSLSQTDVLVLGAGGASRAVAYALLCAGVNQLTFWARNRDRAIETLALANHVNAVVRQGEAHIHLKTDIDACLSARTRLVINTTPVGMHPHTAESPMTPEQMGRCPEGTLFYDLVYNPLQTTFLAQAAALGFPTQDGLAMLVHQGAKSFELWTGYTVPPETIAAAFAQLRNTLH